MIEHPLGVVVAVGSILIFHGSVYVLVSLNMGWRFGYWVTGASLFGLMFIMSFFWVVTALGPRGAEPSWHVVGAAPEPIAQATVEEQTLTRYSTYPSGWEEAEGEEDPLFEDVDAVGSAVGNCLDANVEDMPPDDREVCGQAQALEPADLPVREGSEIIATNEVVDVRFTEDSGVRIAQARVEPTTRDPRYTDNEEGVLVGEPFHVALYRDPGSLRVPPLKYLIGSTLLLLLHLWGLSRAERKVLSPIVAL